MKSKHRHLFITDLSDEHMAAFKEYCREQCRSQSEQLRFWIMTAINGGNSEA